MKSQTITVPSVGTNKGFTAVQTYAYDSLNRLKSAQETVSNNQTWKQTFTYDRYGNRQFDEANTSTLPKNCGGAICSTDAPVVNPTVNTTNNRLNGYTFDAAGNTTKDAANRRFTYDGENKQTKVETLDANNNPITTLGEYFYDGDGKRVKKVTNSETTIFVYDAQGKLVAEYSNQTNTNQQVSYLTSDNLGTPRINTDRDGNTIARHDYLPFGEEAFTQQRTNGLSYTTNDTVRQGFTGYQKDDETDLDFAQARMFGSGVGRFTSPRSKFLILNEFERGYPAVEIIWCEFGWKSKKRHR